MKARIPTVVSLFFCLLLLPTSIKAQTYFKLSEASDNFFNHRVTRFPNGDVLIGDSSLDALRNGGINGEVVMTRLDNCGNEIWSYGYVIPDGYLEFKDFRVNEAEEIFVYGSFYKDLDEFIFLLKIDGTFGITAEFTLLDPGTVDHFSYSMDLKNGLLMIYGLRLDFNTQKQGFVAIFNENLGFQWAKYFAPFESEGTAIISQDMGFLGNSDNDLIKLDADGELEWAHTLQADPNTHTVSGPVEVPGGFIFEAHAEGLSFFYKVDMGGQLLWKSDLFYASDYGAVSSLLPDGNLICSYNYPEASSNQLCQLVLAPNGLIFDQRRLDIGKSKNTGNLYQSIYEGKTMTIAGNDDPSSIDVEDIKDFILQFELASSHDNCLQWETFEELLPNTNDLNLAPLDLTSSSFNMQVERKMKTDSSSFSLPLMEICSAVVDPDLLQKDTFLQCGEDWLAYLPAADFVWSDGHTDNPRRISLPGTYQARNSSCIDPLIAAYTLEKPDCGCQIYLPNAFSPNNDGINDQLEYFSDCTFDKVEISVYNRWGQRLYLSQAQDQFWDGRYQQEFLPSGVYMVMLKYQWINFDGIVSEGSLFQDVTLLR